MVEEVETLMVRVTGRIIMINLKVKKILVMIEEEGDMIELLLKISITETQNLNHSNGDKKKTRMLLHNRMRKSITVQLKWKVSACR